MSQLQSAAVILTLGSLLCIPVVVLVMGKQGPPEPMIHQSSRGEVVSVLDIHQPPESLILQTWRGEVELELRKQAPEAGYVADTKSWEELWKAYRGGEQLPQVDFTEHLILVGVNSDPNKIGAGLTVSEKGELAVMYSSTLIGFEDPKTCAYQFAKISRKGIKSINGRPIKSE